MKLMKLGSRQNSSKINGIRLYRINFLFSNTRAHAKKLGALSFSIQKLARRSFLFIIGEKKNTFHKFQS